MNSEGRVKALVRDRNVMEPIRWMVQTMLPKSLRAMKFYFTTVYQEIWVGVALTAYAYYKISYGGKKAVADKSSGAGHH